MLLSLRGWGPEHFDRATPALLSGARYALWAEKAAVMLHNAEANAEMHIDRKDPRLAELLRVRVAAAEFVSLIRPAMFPEDDDG